MPRLLLGPSVKITPWPYLNGPPPNDTRIVGDGPDHTNVAHLGGNVVVFATMTSIVAGIAHWIAVWSTAMPAGVNVVSSAEKLQAASAEIGDATVRTADTETNRRTYRIRLISTRHPTRLLDLRTHAPSARHRRRQQT